MPLAPIESSSSKSMSSQSPHVSVEFRAVSPKYSFNDLILSSSTKEELFTVVNAQLNWKRIFTDWGLSSVMRDKQSLFVNLYGASGTGKTMAAHAIASALNKQIICVNYADIESKYVGETSKNLTHLFTNTTVSDSIIFFDEADAMLSKRVTNMNNATDVSVNQTRSVLLSLMNDFNGMIIFATNFISNYDSAFMRRIQYHILFELPNDELREKLWKHYIPPQMPVEIDLSRLVCLSNGMSGSDIANSVLKAALRAANKHASIIKQTDFEEAITTIKQSVQANQKGAFVQKSEIIPESEVPSDIRDRIITKEGEKQ